MVVAVFYQLIIVADGFFQLPIALRRLVSAPAHDCNASKIAWPSLCSIMLALLRLFLKFAVIFEFLKFPLLFDSVILIHVYFHSL